jgi:AraC-like DNA-binding protein
MLDSFTYTDLSANGLFEAYCQHYKIAVNNNTVTLPEKYGKVQLKNILLPGDIEVVFANFDFLNDTLVTHELETEQKFALWISLSEGEAQEFSLKDDLLTIKEREQANAYLLCSLFPYKHLRKKGTKGKSILIFIPPYLLDSLGGEKSKEFLMAKYYSLKCRGLSLIKLGEKEMFKVNDLFYQWESNQNIIGITKYVFQLLEWYFTKLSIFINDENIQQTLTDTQAQDLHALQLFMDEHLHVGKLDFQVFEKSVNTSFSKLKNLFARMYGKTLYDYFHEKKMISAKKILTNTDKNISEIAYELGFANPSNFSAAFKRYFSITPNEYRLQLKNTIII